MIEEGEEQDWKSIGTFLDDYYPQFAIMGIFGTVSVFLINSSPDETPKVVAQSGAFASLVIFAFTAAWICQRAFQELLDDLHSDNRPFFTEFGYVVIIFCTATLALTILNFSLTYSEIATFAIRLGISVIAFLGYLRIYPRNRYNAESDASNIAVVAAGIMVLVVPALENGIAFVFDQHFESPHLVTSAYALFFITMHLATSECVFGGLKLKRLVERARNIGPNQDALEVIKSTICSFEISAALAGSFILLLLLGMDSIARSYTQNVGYFGIQGYYWAELMFYQISGFVGFVCFGLLTMPGDECERLRREKLLAILAGAISIAAITELLLAWFDVIGQHMVLL